MGLEDSIESIISTVNACIGHERKEGGLLEHVKTVVEVYNNEYGVEEPAIWIVQHPITVNSKDNLSQELTLIFTIEFACVEWDSNPLIAEKKSRQLSYRVAQSIKNNYRRIQYELVEDRIIENVKFNTLYPVGEMDVEGMTDKTPVSGIILDFEFTVDWPNYC